MKTLLFYLQIFLLVGSNIVHAQGSIKPIDKAELKLYYKLSFQRDSTDIHSVREDVFVLQIGNDLSRFISHGNFCVDSVLMANPDLDFESRRNLAFGGPRYSHHWDIFKHYDDGVIVTTDYVMPDKYLYREDIDLFHWKLTGETSTISGYEVQKAVTEFAGRKWVAWFASEIPINDGPYKFNGLPGLILKISDTKQHYVFDLLSMHTAKTEKENIYYRDFSFIETTKSQFFAAKERFRQDIIGGLLTSGMPVHEDTDLDRAQQNMLRRNNPIELTAD